MDTIYEPGQAYSPYRDLFESAPIAYHEIDREGIITRVNGAECELLRLEAEEMIGRHIWEFVSPSDRIASRIAIAQKMEQGLDLAPFEREYVRRDGARLILEIHERHILDPDGGVTGIRTAMIDRTGSRTAEEARQEEHRWLETTIAAITDGVIAIDSSGSIRFLNPVAEKLTGWSSVGAGGMDIDRVFRTIDHLTGKPPEWPMLSVLRQGAFRDLTGNRLLVPENGKSIPIELSCAPIEHAGLIIGCVLIFRPVLTPPLQTE